MGWFRRSRGMAAAPSADRPGDPELFRRMRLGDESALEALYARYGGLVYTLALRIVGDPELAREVLQDTFLRSWDGREGYDPARGRVPWWLMGIARNRAIDVLRSRSHQGRVREQAHLPRAREPAHSATEEVQLMRRTVVDALQTLSPAQREAIELAYYAGLTQAEIARELKEPLGTVKSRMREGMDRLRLVLRPVIGPNEEGIETP
jgi:RNA polymerase sigma-70 factor, ECF subfamily